MNVLSLGSPRRTRAGINSKRSSINFKRQPIRELRQLRSIANCLRGVSRCSPHVEVWFGRPRFADSGKHCIELEARPLAIAIDSHELLQNAGTLDGATLLQPQSNSELGENRSDSVLAIVPVVEHGEDTQELSIHSILELHLPPGTGPAVQRGWRELLDTVATIAAEFHVREQLRELRGERGHYDQSLELMRRFQRAEDLKETAYEIANEGRRFASADRLSVVVKQGYDWNVLSASGVERVEPRADVTKRLQQLAAATSDWGELVEYSDVATDELNELPPTLSELVQRHVDESQARRLVAVPVQQVAVEEASSRSTSTEHTRGIGRGTIHHCRAGPLAAACSGARGTEPVFTRSIKAA